MSRNDLVERPHRNAARAGLRQRRLRDEMGDEAYETMRAGADDRPFVVFGIVALVIFGAVVLAVTALGL